MKVAARNSQSGSQASLPVPTGGEAFGDGALIELIRGKGESAGLSLLLKQGKQRIIRKSHLRQSVTYVPPDLPLDLLRRVHLPSGTTGCGSTTQLFGELVELFIAKFGCEARDAKLATYFVLTTHVIDCVDVAPNMGLIAEPGDGANLLRGFSATCRHGLLSADLPLLKFPRGFYPTLLIGRSTFSNPQFGELRASQYRGFGIFRGHNVIDGFGARAILIDDDSPDEIVRLCAAQICLQSRRAGARALDDAAIRKIADHFQPKLLEYRLENHAAVRESNFDVPEFAGTTRLAARTFGFCIANDPKLQGEIVELLKSQDECFRGARCMNFQGIVIEAMLVTIHESKLSVHVGELTTLANAILMGRGEDLQIKPRKVGSIMRSLQFPLIRDNRGYGFLLTKDLCRWVHWLARDRDVPTSMQPVEGCEYCAELAFGTGVM